MGRGERLATLMIIVIFVGKQAQGKTGMVLYLGGAYKLRVFTSIILS